MICNILFLWLIRLVSDGWCRMNYEASAPGVICLFAHYYHTLGNHQESKTNFSNTQDLHNQNYETRGFRNGFSPQECMVSTC